MQGLARDQDDHQESWKGKQEVHTAGNDPGKREQIFGYIDFPYQGTVINDRAHRKVSTFRIKIEQNLPCQQIKEIVGDIKTENRRKYHGSNGHHQ